MKIKNAPIPLKIANTTTLWNGTLCVQTELKESG